jgi:uncharacterized protein YjbJ (UPF0337 family)
MNSHRMERGWKHLEGTIRKQWADLTDDDLHHVEWSWQKLAGVIQTRYGRGKEAVDQELKDFRREHENQATGPQLAS